MRFSQQCCWRFKCSGMCHCLSGELFWSSVCLYLQSQAFSEESKLLALTDPEDETMILQNKGNFLSRSTMSHHKILESSTELLPPLLFFITSQLVKALTNNSKHNYLVITQTIWLNALLLCPHIQHNWMSHTHLDWTVSTFVRANVRARMLTG